MKSDIQLERPEEYVAFELDHSKNRDWNFGVATTAQVRGILLDCGIPAELVEHALSIAHARGAGGKFLITPDEELITALTPEQRAKLYLVLARQSENQYMHSPYRFPTGDLT
ncbi:MAG TPA: hypothetical protein PKA41_11890, partial [Verrucomicrobiota bacterium]|nr:hypothetical protein [Verrucomicrobiota bacterium]